MKKKQSLKNILLRIKENNKTKSNATRNVEREKKRCHITSKLSNNNNHMKKNQWPVTNL